MSEPVLFNIGNTHIQRKMPGSSKVEIFPTSDFSDDMIPAGLPAAAACVVPFCIPVLKRKNVFLVNAETASGILDFSRVDSSTIGADRIANAAMLASAGTLLPAAVVDAGTAVTMEVVDRNRAFLGGMIAPGRALLHNALHIGTRLLPEIPFNAPLPPVPAGCTQDAIRAGTDLLLLDGLKAMLERIRNLFPDEKVRFIVCGGDAPFFRRHIPDLEQAPEDFTLSGVSFIYRSHFS